jgi:hypothetical protein
MYCVIDWYTLIKLYSLDQISSQWIYRAEDGTRREVGHGHGEILLMKHATFTSWCFLLSFGILYYDYDDLL